MVVYAVAEVKKSLSGMFHALPPKTTDSGNVMTARSLFPSVKAQFLLDKLQVLCHHPFHEFAFYIAFYMNVNVTHSEPGANGLAGPFRGVNSRAWSGFRSSYRTRQRRDVNEEAGFYIN